jgi:hypothetical protein
MCVMMVAVRPAAVALTEEVGLTAAGEAGEGLYVEFYYHHTYYFVPRTSGITVSLAEILQKLGGGLPSIDDVASVVATGRMSNYIYPSKAESGNDWNVTIDDELVPNRCLRKTPDEPARRTSGWGSHTSPHISQSLCAETYSSAMRVYVSAHKDVGRETRGDPSDDGRRAASRRVTATARQVASAPRLAFSCLPLVAATSSPVSELWGTREGSRRVLKVFENSMRFKV